MKTSRLLTILFLATLLPAQTGGDVAGQWLFTLDTQGGVRTANTTFQVDGDQVTGKWEKSDVKGTFANGTLKLEFPMTSEEGGFSATLKVTGKLESGQLTGNWEFGEYSGTYTAKKKE